MSLEYDLKNQMDRLIDYAYRDDDFRYKNSFKWYRIVIMNRENPEAHGEYHYSGEEKYTIRLYQNNEKTETNANRIKTLIHELAHHIQFRRNRDIKIEHHGKEFYDEYTKLLYAAFDLKIFTPHEFLTRLLDADEDEKINAIVRNYKPTNVDEVSDEITVNVYNAFAVKDDLKNLGFKWNGLSKAWYITVDKNDEQAVRKDVLELGVDDEDIEVTHKWNLKMITDSRVKPVNFSIKGDYLNSYALFLANLLNIDCVPTIVCRNDMNYPYLDMLNYTIILPVYDDREEALLIQTVVYIAEYMYCLYQYRNGMDGIKSHVSDLMFIGDEGFTKAKYELNACSFAVFINGQMFKLNSKIMTFHPYFDEDELVRNAAKISYDWSRDQIDNALRKSGFQPEKLVNRIKRLVKAKKEKND